MKRILAVLTAVFAFTFLSAAQTGGASGSSGGQSGTADQTGTEHAAHKKGGGGTLTGCLSGPNDEGAYELKSGKRTVEVGGLDDLSKHVGHEVRLHGSWAKSGSEIGEKEGSEAAEKKGGEAAEKKGGNEEKAERHFKVASIDHISDTCKAGGAGAKSKKGSSSGTTQPSTPPKL
ncbi:MAG TPA: hypothetical protein VFR24_22390 [Candidatus Angelobacter sp.]|nr:hypothetical protein [Candidatus Angelobacter sp.]